jgi:D-arabinose 1-dehydrogenase-like Zn-dependent alcohol dehydrogenase
MSGNMSKKILLTGAGPMAQDHFRVLKALGYDVTVIGRSESSARQFEEKTGQKVHAGGLMAFPAEEIKTFDASIVCVGMEQLAAATLHLLQNCKMARKKFLLKSRQV